LIAQKLQLALGAQGAREKAAEQLSESWEGFVTGMIPFAKKLQFLYRFEYNSYLSTNNLINQADRLLARCSLQFQW